MTLGKQTFKYNLRLVSIDTIYSIIKMLTRTQDNILGFLLSHPDEQVTIRGIAKRLGKSYTLVYNNIADLEKRQIIRKNHVPPAQIIGLHDSLPMRILIDIELKIRKDFLKKHPWAELMLNDLLFSVEDPFFILIIFGSYAKGIQTKKSDIDLLIITQTDKQTQEVETTINRTFTKVRKNSVVVLVEEFMEMISHPQEFNVGNEAVKHHILLYGVEQYYQIIRKQCKPQN